jgi:hypothetical protein
MNLQDAKIAMRALNLDGGEGSGVKGHTTEKQSALGTARESVVHAGKEYNILKGEKGFTYEHKESGARGGWHATGKEAAQAAVAHRESRGPTQPVSLGHTQMTGVLGVASGTYFNVNGKWVAR